MAEDEESQATRRLSNIKVKEVSVVDAAAIKRTFLVVKRDETMTKKTDQTVDPAASKTAAIEKTTTPETAETVPATETPVEKAGVEVAIAKHYGYGSDEPFMYISMDGPLMKLLPVFAQMSQNLSTDEQTTLAKRALEAVEKGTDVTPEEAKVEKAKRMTASRATLLDNAIDSLSALKDEFADKDVEAVAEVVAEVTDGVAKANTGQVAKSNETLTTAMLAVVEILKDIKTDVKASADKTDELAKRVETVEKTQPVAQSEAPEAPTTTVQKTKSNSELFGSIIG